MYAQTPHTSSSPGIRGHIEKHEPEGKGALSPCEAATRAALEIQLRKLLIFSYAIFFLIPLCIGKLA